jgi:large subunit ribosomal protein L7Ae
LKHVTYLIEQKKAKLVLIANDVDPIEMVVFLPTLCRSMDIPYAIVQNRAKLGKLVRQSSAAVVCLTDFKDNQNDLQNIQKICRENFNSVKLEPKKPEKGYKSIVREKHLNNLKAMEDSRK